MSFKQSIWFKLWTRRDRQTISSANFNHHFLESVPGRHTKDQICKKRQAMGETSGKWWSPAGAHPTWEWGLGGDLWWWLLLLCCGTKRRKVSISLAGSGLQLSPQQHFSSIKSQAKNVCKLQKNNVFTMKEQGNILVPAIWMSPLEAKRRNIRQYVGQACLNEADPTATQDNSRLSLTSKEAESYPQNAYDHKQ